MLLNALPISWFFVLTLAYPTARTFLFSIATSLHTLANRVAGYARTDKLYGSHAKICEHIFLCLRFIAARKTDFMYEDSFMHKSLGSPMQKSSIAKISLTIWRRFCGSKFTIYCGAQYYANIPSHSTTTPPSNHLMKMGFYVERDFIQRWREKKRG